MSGTIWDEKHLKALLRLSRYPWQFIEQDPWQSWIKQHGGQKLIYEYLNTLPLPPNQRDLFDIIMAHPYASVQVYSDKLHVSRRTYANRLNDLLSNLLAHINAWEPEAQAPETGPPHNLPAPLTPLIGAEKSAAAIMILLRRPGTRLLTISGPGGVGKTRLALQVAAETRAEFLDGPRFVPLASIQNPAHLPQQMAQVLGLHVKQNTSWPHALKSYLRGRRSLLILDGFEHIITAAPFVTELLQAAPDLKILVTSREILHVYGEHCFQVPLLTLPDPAAPQSFEQLKDTPAIQLFNERASAVCPGFTLSKGNIAQVNEICQQLDGLPLAIELAAALTRFFPLRHILQQAKHRPGFLRQRMRDVPSRQQDLWSVTNWSYQLLNEEEQDLFRRLSIFHGWTREAAKEVCDLADDHPGLEILADKSLIQVATGDDQAYFHMLKATRQYAMAQLETHGNASATRHRHAHYYLDLAEAGEQAIGTPQQKTWSLQIEQEHQNMQTALRWLMQQKESDKALRITGAVWRFWQVNGSLSESVHWLEETLAQSRELKTTARVKTLWGAGWLNVCQGNFKRAQGQFEEGLALAKDLRTQQLVAQILAGMGEVKCNQRDFNAAQTCFTQSLSMFQDSGNQEEIAWSLDHLGRMALHQKDTARARSWFEMSLALFRDLGNPWGIASLLDHLGHTSWIQGEYKYAQEMLEESMRLLHDIGNRWFSAWTLYKTVTETPRTGNLHEAQRVLSKNLPIHVASQNMMGILAGLEGTASLAVVQGDQVRAVKLCGALQSLLNPLNMPVPIALSQSNIEQTLSLSKGIFTAAWQTGRAMTVEEAVDCAMKVLC